MAEYMRRAQFQEDLLDGPRSSKALFSGGRGYGNDLECIRMSCEIDLEIRDGPVVHCVVYLDN